MMVQACQALNGGDVCTKTETIKVNGVELLLEKWPRSLAVSARGDGECPVGTTLDQNALGECLELVGNETLGYSQMSVFAPFSNDLVAICVAQSGGDSCYTPRWALKYYLSIVNPGFDSILNNEDASVDTNTNTDVPQEESSNTFIPEQQMYSSQVSKCKGICSPGAIAALTLGVGAIIGIIVGVIVFLVVTGYGGKKGYDLYIERKKMGMVGKELRIK